MGWLAGNLQIATLCPESETPRIRRGVVAVRSAAEEGLTRKGNQTAICMHTEIDAQKMVMRRNMSLVTVVTLSVSVWPLKAFVVV